MDNDKNGWNREYADSAFYFGCIGEAGHYLWNTRGWQVRENGLPVDFPSKWGGYGLRIDGCFAPNLPGEPQGVANLYHGAGWTILAFWDRSVDKRGGCNSTFLFRGTHTFDEAVALARKYFPFVCERFKFEITEHKGA